MFSNDPPVNDAQIDNRVAFFKSVFPFDADNITELRRWSGRIDATPDLIPFIGPLGAIEGLAVAAGFSSHGLGISPVIAKGIAQFLTTGRLPANLEPFAPTRILERQFQHDAGAL
jgi:glycine/D-amino acid oxidase-like deaminating enzyme